MLSTAYLTFTILWTIYMAFETYTYVRPQSRPHVFGFLVTHFFLAPISFALSATGGVLRDRLTAAYRSADEERDNFHRSGPRKLIG